MKKIELTLNNRISLVPFSGETTIFVVSTGDFGITHSIPQSVRRIRSIVKADTGKAILSESPMGFNRTVKIILASEEASEEEFVRQVKMLFEQTRSAEK